MRVRTGQRNWPGVLLVLGNQATTKVRAKSESESVSTPAIKKKKEEKKETLGPDMG